MLMRELPKNKKIIVFDGICNLCDSAVQFVVKHDHRDIFRFVSIQSSLGQEIIKHIGIHDKNIDSVILYEPGKAYYYKSDAALEIAKSLGGIFHFGTIFKIIPAGIRDTLYDYIARNRYKWCGKKEFCLLPTQDLKYKFLE